MTMAIATNAPNTGKKKRVIMRAMPTKKPAPKKQRKTPLPDLHDERSIDAGWQELEDRIERRG